MSESEIWKLLKLLLPKGRPMAPEPDPEYIESPTEQETDVMEYALATTYASKFTLFGEMVHVYMLENGRPVIDANSFAAVLAILTMREPTQEEELQVQEFGRWLRRLPATQGEA